MSEPGAQRHVHVGDRARAREARIDVDDRRAARLRLHHPLEPDRMALGHVRAHDHDAVAVLQILLEGRGAAATERCPQTGHGGGVSYARLVLDLHRAERGVELLHEVVLLVVEGRASEAREAERAAQRPALVVVLLPRAPPRRRSPGRRSSPSRRRAAAPPTRVPCGRRYLIVCSRPGPVTRLFVAAPFGHSRPREIGLAGSPSIWVISPSRTNTRWPHPTAQYGQIESTTLLPSVRGARPADRDDCAAAPFPAGSVRNCRSTGQRSLHDAKATLPPLLAWCTRSVGVSHVFPRRGQPPAVTVYVPGPSWPGEHGRVRVLGHRRR